MAYFSDRKHSSFKTKRSADVASEWQPVRWIACLLTVSTGLTISVVTYAQEVEQVTDGFSQQSSVLLRGTTGSGETEAVFGENDPIQIGTTGDRTSNTEDGAAEGLTIASQRDTSDPERQLQQRVRPAQPALPVVDPEVTGTPSARSNPRVETSQAGTGALPRSNPFAATGFRIGSWRAFTSLEQTVGHSSNIEGVAMGKAAGFSQSRVDLSLRSDWSRHSARVDANATLRQAFNSDIEDLPTAGITGALNLDLADGYAVNFSANYNYLTESVSSNNITAAAAQRPGQHSYGGSAELARTDRRLTFSLRGSVGRTEHEDIKLTSGGMQTQRDRDNTLYTLVGRAGYQASPVLAPFVELEAGFRDYDLKSDFNGEARDTAILAARVGVGVDLGEKLNGEVAIGYRNERFVSGDLEDLSTLTLDGNINWSPERDTTVSLTAQTGMAGSTTAGQNGAVTFGAGLGAERQITDRLSVNANAGIDINQQDDGSRTDTIVTTGIGFNYWISRFMALTGAVEYTNQQSTAGPSQEYDETVVRAGLRFQR